MELGSLGVSARMVGRMNPKPALRVLAVAVIAASLSGCASHEPTRAAMVPQTAGGEYGYSDTQLGPTRYEVSYVSPRLNASTDGSDSHGLEAEKQRMYELALWRAAQVADSKGYPAFRVTQESRDVDVTVNRQRTVPPPYFGPFGPWPYRRWPYHGPYGYWPHYYDYDYYDWPAYSRTTASGRITVKLTVELLPSMQDGALETASTLDHLRKTHASDGFTGTY
jgi:hypothetical protein